MSESEPVVSQVVEITDRTVVLFRISDDDQPVSQTLADFGNWCCKAGVNPLCIVVRGDGIGLEVLSTETMNAAGWYKDNENCTCHERDGSLQP